MEKPKKVIGYSKRSKLAYIWVKKTPGGGAFLVSTSKGWPQVWMVDVQNMEFVNGGKPE